MNFGPGVSPQVQKMHNFGSVHFVGPGVTNSPVTAIHMWGYIPVRITGVLVIFIVCEMLTCIFCFLSVQAEVLSASNAVIRIHIMAADKTTCTSC